MINEEEGEIDKFKYQGSYLKKLFLQERYIKCGLIEKKIGVR